MRDVCCRCRMMLCRFAALSKVILCCLVFCSCASWLLPPLEVSAVEISAHEVTIRFSDAVDKNAVIDAFSFMQDGEAIGGDFCFYDNVMTFAPDMGIAERHNYEIRITTGAQSVLGRSLIENYVYTFTKKTETVRPRVVSVVPENEAVCSGGIVEFAITFSESVDIQSFQNAFSLSPAVPYRLKWNNEEDSVRVCFDSPLSLSKRYIVTIAKSLCDKNNNYMASDFTSDFFNGTDLMPPSYTFLYCYENAEIVLSGVHENIPASAHLLLDFSEEVAVDSVSSFISFKPAVAYSVVPDRITKKRVKIEFAEKIAWEKEYRVTLEKGMADVSGNKIAHDKSYLLKFNNESDRPVTFIEGYFKMDDDNFLRIGNETDYSYMTLPVEHFSTIAEKETTYYAVFRISNEAQSLDYISALEHMSIVATNSCASFLLKKITLLDNDALAASEIASFDAIVRARANAWNLCCVQCVVIVENADDHGLVRFIAHAGLQDTNGNELSETAQFTYNKL